MRTHLLPFHVPDIGEAEIASVVETLRSGRLTTGPKVKQFENAFARYIGCEHAIAVNSGTAALHLALEAVGITEGDEGVRSSSCGILRPWQSGIRVTPLAKQVPDKSE